VLNRAPWLERLEETYATTPGFLELATHFLLVARRRKAMAKSEPDPNFGTIRLLAARARLLRRTIHYLTR
jgi:hypothetical protein